MVPENVDAPRAPKARSILLGGILPVVIFTFVEEYYGTLAGLIAGMVFGVGETLWEWKKNGKVETLTWVGNGFLIVLGSISLFSGTGIWFKLQPAIIEFVMAVFMIGSFVLSKPFLLLMAKKQGTLQNAPPEVRDGLEKRLGGLTFRVGIFFLIHSGIAAWAAFYWSTRAWAILKGVGFTVSLFPYMIVEIIFIRLSLRRQKHGT